MIAHMQQPGQNTKYVELSPSKCCIFQVLTTWPIFLHKM